MNVQFYTLAKRVNSTKQPSGSGLTIACQLKDGTSVLSPTLIISGSGTITGYNYAYISDWKKYYFITDTTINTGGRYEVAMTCDELASWKASIGNYSCFVQRAASTYNSMIYDNAISNTENNITATSASTDLPVPFDFDAGTYIVRIVNNSSDGFGVTAYAMTLSQLKQTLSFMFTESNFADVLSDAAVKAIWNPFQYFISIIWLPIETINFIQIPEALHKVVCGTFTTDVETEVISQDGVSITMNNINMPAATYSDWRGYVSAFSAYKMFLPGVGTVGLAASDIKDGISILIKVDSMTGVAQYFIHGGATVDAPIIATYSGYVGVNIQIAQMNSMFSSANSVTSKAAESGNILDKIGNTVEKIGEKVVAKVAGSITNNDDTASINGDVSQKYLLKTNTSVIVTLHARGSGEYPISVQGRPLCRNVQLGTLSGYIECGNASIDIGGYAGEKDAVNNYLNGGFYYE